MVDGKLRKMALLIERMNLIFQKLEHAMYFITFMQGETYNEDWLQDLEPHDVTQVLKISPDSGSILIHVEVQMMCKEL